MFCPNCGNKNLIDQKFCRSCGLGLEKIAQSVAEQLPAELDENLQAQKNRLEWWGMAALSVFGAGVLGLLLFGIIYKTMTMIVQGKILAGIGLLGLVAMVACGLIAVILFAKAKEVEEASTKRRLQQPAAQGETTGNLLPQVHLESIPSVTEQTTELLLAEKKGGSKES